jgi:hypothetical protein
MIFTPLQNFCDPIKKNMIVGACGRHGTEEKEYVLEFCR